LASSSRPQQAKNCPGLVTSTLMYIVGSGFVTIAPPSLLCLGYRWRCNRQRVPETQGMPSPSVHIFVADQQNAVGLQSQASQQLECVHHLPLPLAGNVGEYDRDEQQSSAKPNLASLDSSQ